MGRGALRRYRRHDAHPPVQAPRLGAGTRRWPTASWTRSTGSATRTQSRATRQASGLRPDCPWPRRISGTRGASLTPTAPAGCGFGIGSRCAPSCPSSSIRNAASATLASARSISRHAGAAVASTSSASRTRCPRPAGVVIACPASRRRTPSGSPAATSRAASTGGSSGRAILARHAVLQHPRVRSSPPSTTAFRRWIGVNLGEILTLIRRKRYFVLHAPRQTGKTSALLALRDLLNGDAAVDYRCVYVTSRPPRRCAKTWGAPCASY